MKSNILFAKVSEFSLYALAFFMPLWILPFTQDFVGFPKQVLLVVLVFLGIVSWLAKSMSEGTLLFRMTWLHVPVLAMLAVTVASSFTSIWRYASFWGWPLDTRDNLLTLFAFVLLYFFMTQAVQGTSQLFKIFLVSAFSCALASLFGILQAYKVFLLPFPFARDAGFNTLGSVPGIAMLGAFLLPLCLMVAFSFKGALRWIFFSFCFIFLVSLVVINSFNAWIALAAGLFALILFEMWNMKRRKEFAWIFLPMALLVIALFFGVFKMNVPFSPIFGVGVVTNQGGIRIARETLQDNPLLGSGPGTFVIDYTQYHSPASNATIFWGTRFSSGASEVLDTLTTKGILGAISLLLILGTGLFFGAKRLMKSELDSVSWFLGLGAFASFFGIAVSQFLYASTFTLSFLFWIMLGALGIFIGGEQKKISISPPSFLAIVSSFTFLLVFIFGLGLLFIGGQKYVAEMRYWQGATAASKGDAKTAIQKVLSAARLNPAGDIYWRDLSQLYLNDIGRISADTNLSKEDKQKQTQDAVSNAVNSARFAVTRGSVNVANWNVQGFLYRNLIGVPGSEELVTAGYETSYQRAISLDPSSPFSWTELGRAYVLQAQSLASKEGSQVKRSEVLVKALEKLQKAVELKSDYAPAHYLIAVVYDQQGKSDEAVKKLEETKLVAPNDVGLAFQLGVIYWQKQELLKAQAELEGTVSLSPAYSNARYILGLVYDKQGKREDALTQFSKIAELNPQNQEVQKILANLQAGKPALEGVVQELPPISENPPEIKGKE